MNASQQPTARELAHQAAQAGAGSGRRLRATTGAMPVEEFTALCRRTSELIARADAILGGSGRCDYSEDPAQPEVCTTCHALRGELCRRNELT